MKILLSLFILHNELVNVWTHLLGALLVVYLVFYIAIFLQPNFHIKEQFQGQVQQYFTPFYDEIQNLEFFFFYKNFSLFL